MKRRAQWTTAPVIKASVFALTLLCAAPAVAQGDKKAGGDKVKTMASRDTMKVDANVKSKILDNGLELLVIEDHSLPLVTIEIAVKNGAFTEPPEFNGLSHLYEHMFFKANKAIPTQEKYLERSRELGLSWNGTTGDERVNYYFTMGVAQLDEGMEFMSDALLTPLFEEKELVKERQVVIGEVDRNESNPYFHLYREMDQKMFYKYPTRKDSLGDRETITTATREKMLTMKTKYYVPNNSALVVAGDVTMAKAEELAKKYFGKWEKGPDPFKADPVPMHPKIKRPEVLIINQPIKTATVRMGWHGPSVGKDPASTYAADVFHFILGQRNSAFQKVLVDSGLTLQVGASYYTLNHTGPISVSFVTQPEKLEPAVKAVQEEMAKFAQDDYFTDEQLETAKRLLAVEFLYSLEKTSSYAHTVSFWWAVAGVDYLDTYLDKLKAVTRSDIQKYLKTYINRKNYVMGILISPENQKKLGLDDKAVKKWARPIKLAKGKVKKIKKGKK